VRHLRPFLKSCSVPPKEPGVSAVTRDRYAAEMTRIRACIARTDPADVRLRVLLVCAHERARRRCERDTRPSIAVSRPERVAAGKKDRHHEIREYARLVPRICAVADRVLPDAAQVLVVSRGDDALLQLGRRVAGHFPQVGGKWAGFYPENGKDAVALLDALCAEGYQFIVFPATAFWWLEYYEKLASRLLARGRAIWHDGDCAIFALEAGGGEWMA
jgi:hypothetical protein